ncbi:MAG TPA: hypothetical protein VHA82_10945 [Ramlibacter sp.]|uniref:hypothetical protein n=1 Tax=Ramlibacter sp. TaxID=1917967 RepID=UPI002BD8D42E|nr:hypothetical protein [Ramlibacter sp.]HVZ44316.1 hypothetical protein [Ramlibacter sp.]
MAVLMIMQWDGVTPAQYDKVCELVNFQVDHPKGGLFHVAAISDKGLRVADLWDNAQDFQAFVEQRLMPGVHKAGIQTEPKVEVWPAHNVFTPGYVAK